MCTVHTDHAVPTKFNAALAATSFEDVWLASVAIRRKASNVMHAVVLVLHIIMRLASYVLLAHALLSLTNDQQDWSCCK